MQRQVYETACGFEALAGEWHDLLARTTFNTPFMTQEWQSTWWRGLGEGDLAIVAWRDAGRLVGLAPLYRQWNGERLVFSLVGCLEVSDYLDVLVETGYEERVYTALLDWLTTEAPSWDVIDLCNLPAVSQTHTLLQQMASARGFSAHAVQEDVCPVIPLPPSWEGYLEMLEKKQRHEVRRKLRRSEEFSQSVSWYIVGPEHDLDAEIDAFIDLHTRSRTDKQQFMNPQMAAFFHRAGRMAAEQGWLQLSFLTVGDQRAAAMWCFDYHNTLWVYNSGYDPQQFSEISPGWVLLAKVIRHAIELGRARFDFLQGNETYKYRFGGRDEAVYRLWIEK